MRNEKKHTIIHVFLLFILISLISFIIVAQSSNETFLDKTNNKDDSMNVNNYLIARQAKNFNKKKYTWKQPSILKNIYAKSMNHIHFLDEDKSLETIINDARAQSVQQCVDSNEQLRKSKNTEIQKSDATETLMTTLKNKYKSFTKQTNTDSKKIDKYLTPNMEDIFSIQDCVVTADNNLVHFYYNNNDLVQYDINSKYLDQWEIPKKIHFVFVSPVVMNAFDVVAICVQDTNTNDPLHQQTAGLMLWSRLNHFSTHVNNHKYWKVFASNSKQNSPPRLEGKEWFEPDYRAYGYGWSTPCISTSGFDMAINEIPWNERPNYKMWATAGDNNNNRKGNTWVWFRYQYY